MANCAALTNPKSWNKAISFPLVELRLERFCYLWLTPLTLQSWIVCRPLTKGWLCPWQHYCGWWTRVQLWSSHNWSNTSVQPLFQQRTFAHLLFQRLKSPPFPPGPSYCGERGCKKRSTMNTEILASFYIFKCFKMQVWGRMRTPTHTHTHTQ